MAYFTRSKMIQMVGTLAKSNDFFMDGPSENRLNDLEKLIGCQQIAIALGEYIDSLGCDTGNLVENIENFCENLYIQAENLDNPEVVVEKSIENLGLLTDILDEIEIYIVEIASIDLFDFTREDYLEEEIAAVSQQILDLVDNCFAAEQPKISFEYEMPFVVGTY